MLLALPVLGFFGAYILSQVFMEERRDLALLLSPALLIAVCSLALNLIVRSGYRRQRARTNSARTNGISV
jgi:hypothetical protein